MTYIKPKLLINKKQITDNMGTLGMTDFLTLFVNSPEFDIGYHDDYISTTRGERATILYYNGKSIYLDFWEYPAPTHSVAVMERNFDLIIKLQHKKMTEAEFLKCCTDKGMFKDKSDEDKINFFSKIVPWTFFPSRIIQPLIKNGIVNDQKVDSLGFFCGKGWKCRSGMRRHLESLGIQYIDSDQALRSGRPLKDEEYIEKMMKSKFGIVLHGRLSAFTEGKNRREIDYMFLKKPLLLNYLPNYYNKLVNGYHFIYINETTDIASLEKTLNIDLIAENGHQWYIDNASPQGVIRSFKQIVNEKLSEGV